MKGTHGIDLAGILTLILLGFLAHSVHGRFELLNEDKTLDAGTDFIVSSVQYRRRSSTRRVYRAPAGYNVEARCNINYYAPRPSLSCLDDFFYISRNDHPAMNGAEYFCGQGALKRSSSIISIATTAGTAGVYGWYVCRIKTKRIKISGGIVGSPAPILGGKPPSPLPGDLLTGEQSTSLGGATVGASIPPINTASNPSFSDGRQPSNGGISLPLPPTGLPMPAQLPYGPPAPMPLSNANLNPQATADPNSFISTPFRQPSQDNSFYGRAPDNFGNLPNNPQSSYRQPVQFANPSIPATVPQTPSNPGQSNSSMDHPSFFPQHPYQAEPTGNRNDAFANPWPNAARPNGFPWAHATAVNQPPSAPQPNPTNMSQLSLGGPPDSLPNGSPIGPQVGPPVGPPVGLPIGPPIGPLVGPPAGSPASPLPMPSASQNASDANANRNRLRQE